MLTARDVEILKHVSALRGVPIEHLAARFFDADPFTGKKNKNPMRACERRLRELARAGHLAFERQHDGERRRQLVVLANRANPVVRKRARRRRASVRAGAHHVRTQDALVKIEQAIVRRGGALLSVKLDADIRAAEMHGRRTTFGDKYEAAPDAVCKVRMPGLGVGEIAVEYVTSKYTDADIVAKHASFARYDAVVWVADKKRTAERVTALTGMPCKTLM